MTMTRKLHELGQSLWLDNITRELLDSGTLRRYIEQLSITGLTSNPTIFDEAIGGSSRVRRRHPAKGRGRTRRRSPVRRARARGSAPRRRSVPAGIRSQRRHRRLGVDGGIAAARRRRGRRPSRRRAGIHRLADAAQSVRQDSGHAGRRARHRGSRVRRGAGQCHAAVLRSSSTWRRPARTCAPSSGASPRDSIRA